MPDPTITNVDLGSVILKNGQFRDELLTFGGAGTVLEGTILARRSVEDAVPAVADGDNTGDGTVTLSTAIGEPKVGAYILTCIEAVANGGIFNLVDPDGDLVGEYLVMTVGAGASTAFQVAGLGFTITDGAADFAAGDFFTLTVTADGKMVPYVIGGGGGSGVPKAVLTYDVTAAGAGDEAIRNMVSGTVRKERLIIDADGDGSNITDAILEQLRDYTIVSTDVQELTILDNQ